MAVMNISAPQSGPLNNGMTFFALGFRPFFFLAGLSALLLMAGWLLIYRNMLPAPAYYGAITWHGHEMLFGYTATVVAGFLLTATKNWTGIQTLRYWPLAGLSLLWLAGRLLPFIGGVPQALIALVDMAFLPLTALALAFPLFRSRQKQNIPFVFLLLTMAFANALYHLQLLGLAAGTLPSGTQLGIGMVLLLLVVMGGRVIPFFIERGLHGAAIRKWSWIERLAMPSVLLYVLVQTLFPQSPLALLLALAAGLVHAIRLAGWYSKGIWSVSLLWVLFVGYGWVAAGLLMQGLGIILPVPPILALHALTVGGIGVLTLGMMARVAIGHSGRPMKAHPLMGWSFALMVCAAVVRVLVPLFVPTPYSLWIDIAGGLWLLAFLPFFILYFPILTQPRVDGQAG
jgi:uncharacterized protein involved in response to NO